MAKNYDVLADSVVELIGGKDNVRFFTHCVTRLRFNVKDRSIVKMDEIKDLPGVAGAQWSGEQLQIIIGQDVGVRADLQEARFCFGKSSGSRRCRRSPAAEGRKGCRE